MSSMVFMGIPFVLGIELLLALKYEIRDEWILILAALLSSAGAFLWGVLMWEILGKGYARRMQEEEKQ